MCEFSPELQNQLIHQLCSEISRDNERQDLRQALNITNHSVPTMSGTQDYDYPLTSQSPTAANVSLLSQSNLNVFSSLKQLSLIKQTPIPSEILNEFPRMQAHSVSGIFKQLSRAWIAIDNILYIWNYYDGSDPTFYDGINETIIAALVVEPKNKIINGKSFKHLMVVCTASEVVILGLNLNPTGGNVDFDGSDIAKTELMLDTDPLFVVSSDNCIFTCCVGTEHGRIFLGGRDGALHEIDYKPNVGWFSNKRCWKINHSKSTMSYVVPLVSPFLSMSHEESIVQLSIDNSRNLLYARTDKGTIRLFDLGTNGTDLSRTAAMSWQTIQNNAASIARNVDRSNFKSITQMCVIEESESQYLNLFLVTGTGVRLYLTAKGFNYNHETRPYMLALVHVRLPPGFASTSRTKPVNVEKAVHIRGTTLLCCSSDNDSETLWCISSDAFGLQNALQESHSCVDLDQLTWNIIPLDKSPAISGEQLARTVFSRLVDQFSQGRHQFLMLNATSTLIVEKLRPVDQLRELLLDNAGPDNDQVQTFFTALFRPNEACAMSLLLASDDYSTFVHVADWAIQAIVLYGEEPRFSGIRSATSMDQNLSGIQDFTFNPKVVSTPGMLNTSPRKSQQNLGSFLYSQKFMGCCLFMSRVVRLVWDFPLVKERIVHNTKITTLTCTWTQFEVTEALRRVRYLSKVLLKIFDPVLHSLSLGQTGSNYASSEALKVELEAVDHLRLIVTKSEELLAFLVILMDYRVDEILPSLSGSLKKQLRELKFRDFVATNRTDVTSLLCVALFNKLISENVKVDPLIAKLREVCPTVFSADDAICVQANDLLQNGLKAMNSDSQDAYLYESLEMFKKVAASVDLVQVCGYYQQVNFCEGIVDLCISAAAKRDPNNLALLYYQNLKPADDLLGREMFSARQECYQCILNMIHYYHSIVENGGGSIPDGANKLCSKSLTALEAHTFFDGVVSECLSKRDEMLHFAVYHWLLEFGLHEKVLENATQSLEQVLVSQARNSSDKDLVVILDLLWKFYEKNDQYEQAANILCTLAERRSTSVKLSQRVNFLGRALVSAKSSVSKSGPPVNPELVKEIEDKLEVAQVQLKILSAVSKLKMIPLDEKEDAMNALNSELFNLTQLYSDFASTYNLSECKLATIVVAGHSDPTTVEFIWLELIDNLFKEFLTEKNTSSGSSIESLSTRFAIVAKDYVEKSEQFFPLTSIVNHLEKRSCELKMGVSWIFSLFIQLGIDYHVLLMVYIDLWNNKEKIWKMLGEPHHLLCVIDALIRQFLDKLLASGDHKISSLARNEFSEIMCPFVSKELVSLTSLASGDPSCRPLIDSLKRSLTSLERFSLSH